MWGRFTQQFTWQELHALYGITNPPQNIEPRYNLAPTDRAWVVRYNPETKERSLDALRWGLVPHWAKDLSFGARSMNARAETFATMPTFRDAFNADAASSRRAASMSGRRPAPRRALCHPADR